MKFRRLVLVSLVTACTQGAPTGGGEDPAGPGVQRPPVTYYKNGTVETGDLKFASVAAFQASDDFVVHGRRCASDRVPENNRAAPSDCSFSSTTIKGEYAPDVVFTIPVVFHIIQKTDGTGNIPESLIHSQIEVLNEDFDALTGSPGGGGNAGKIRFVLASVDPEGNPTSGIEYVTNNGFFADPGSGLSPMKSQLNWDPARYFNIYTNDANGALGYATFPSESAGDGEDGVVLLYTSVGRDAPQGGIYNQGRTATHEVGHYLGLFHTFQSGCGSAGTPYGSGDLIKDTVAHPEPNFECTAAASSCGGGGLPIENYMNYTPDVCMTKFSVEQVNRMRCSIVNYRSQLVSVEMGENAAPTAAFSSSANNLAVSFLDKSTDTDGTITARSWTFGDGGTSTAANPSHTYATAGTYTVTLKVTDNVGATGTHSAQVTVTGGGGGGGGSALESGVAKPNLSAATGGQLAFFIDVPAGASSLTFRISGGTGDADLYIKRGSAPTTSSYNQRPFLSGNNETVAIQSPQAARYFVMLRGYTAFSGVTLVATIVTSGGGGGFEDTEVNLGAAQGGSKQFSVEVPAGATNLTFEISGGTGDADLYIRRGTAPTTSQWDFRPYLDGNAETVSIAAPQAGTWYVMVRAYSTYSGVTLRVAYD